MRARKMSGAELARYVGFHRSYPSWLLAAPGRNAYREWAVAIERVLDVPVGSLFDLDGDGEDGEP